MRGDRLAALIATCYPSAARRRGEEGRARVRIVVGANGRASSWALAEGTGISRLDSALDCVVRRLQFEPGHRDGRAVDAEVQLPIVFRLR
jgi:protein TonB